MRRGWPKRRRFRRILCRAGGGEGGNWGARGVGEVCTHGECENGLLSLLTRFMACFCAGDLVLNFHSFYMGSIPCCVGELHEGPRKTFDFGFSFLSSSAQIFPNVASAKEETIGISRHASPISLAFLQLSKSIHPLTHTTLLQCPHPLPQTRPCCTSSNINGKQMFRRRMRVSCISSL